GVNWLNRRVPGCSVCSWNLQLVSTGSCSSFAPPTTRPLGSVTLTTRSPVMDWAGAATGNTISEASSDNARIADLLMGPPWKTERCSGDAKGITYRLQANCGGSGRVPLDETSA